MTGRWYVVVAAVAGLVLLLFGLWLDRNLEIVDEVEEGRLAAETASRPLLAAARFLETMGIAAHEREVLLELPPHDHVLILTAPRVEYIGDRRFWALVEWVAAGGHLILAPQLDTDTYDPLLDEFGVVDYSRHGLADRRPSSDEDLAERVESIHLGRRLRFAVPAGTSLDATEFRSLAQPDRILLAGSINDAVLVHRRHDAGAITVLGHPWPLQNLQLGRLDHAALLFELVRVHHRPPAGVMLIAHDDMPSLVALIWDYGKPALAGLGLWLGLWLWAASRHFGPMLPPPERRRRALLEHVEAAGRYLWRRHPARLLAAARLAARRRLERRDPELLHARDAVRAERRATRYGIEVERIAVAIGDQPIDDPGRFTQAIADLQRISRNP